MLPVRAWRETFTSAIGIRNNGGPEEDKSGDLVLDFPLFLAVFPMGEPLRRLCAFFLFSREEAERDT